MKKISISEMQVIGGADFLDGFLCGAGLAMSGTGIGLAVAIISCGRALQLY